jgi:hypothetical protein
MRVPSNKRLERAGGPRYFTRAAVAVGRSVTGLDGFAQMSYVGNESISDIFLISQCATSLRPLLSSRLVALCCEP